MNRCDIAIVGAGPAGLAAAVRAAEAGKSVHVLDEGFGPGGQIWRPAVSSLPDSSGASQGNSQAGRSWRERFEHCGAVLHRGASVFEASGGEGAWRVAAEQSGSRLDVEAARLILATGARERFLPFPGWTLPGVHGNGGIQALVKQGWSVAGKRVVVAGSGPLLLPVAATLVKAGASLLWVAEQALFSALARFGARLAVRPSKVREALRYRRAFSASPYRTGWWVERAQGSDRVESVILTDGRRSVTLPCDLLCVSYGLVPNLELPRALGAAIENGAVVVDDCQQSNVEGLYVAGEPCGIAGVEVALAEGEIAGLAAAGQTVEPALRRQRRTGRILGAAMERAFALRAELLRPPLPETVICRCEDVVAGALDPAWSVRQAKLYSRAGMGPCQGRICGPALSCLYGWEADTVRSPLKPVSLATLLVSNSVED